MAAKLAVDDARDHAVEVGGTLEAPVETAGCLEIGDVDGWDVQDGRDESAGQVTYLGPPFAPVRGDETCPDARGRGSGSF